MINEDSLSQAACKRTDTVFSNFTKPNFLSELRPLAFSIFDQFSSFHSSFRLCQILNLFMTCTAKRGSQLRNGLSSARRILVFCSAEIRRVPTLSFHFSHSHFHTTVGHVNLLHAVLADSLPLLHMRESPHLGVISCLVH